MKPVQHSKLIIGLGVTTLGILMGAASLYLGFHGEYLAFCVVILAGIITFGLGVRMTFQSAEQQ